MRKRNNLKVPIAKQHAFAPPLHAKAGFTLIELLLVAVIILALVTISTPQFKRTFEDLRLTSCAKDISVIVRFCQERSVFERSPYKILIDIDNKTYRIYTYNQDKDSFEPIEGRWGKRFRISDSIDIETEEEELDFSPDGTITPTLIYLTNKEDKTHTILVEGSTGLIKVYDHKFDPEKK